MDLKEKLAQHLIVLQNFKIPSNIHRYNVSGVSKVVLWGRKKPTKTKVGNPIKSQNFGIVKNRFSKTGNVICESANNKKYPEVYNTLKEIIKIVDPNFEYKTITLNKNVLAKPHKDANNTSNSLIIGIGDYTDGGLFVQKNNNEYVLHDIHYKPLYFNGRENMHYTQDFSGERYSIIYY